jgi:hypothetical protein
MGLSFVIKIVYISIIFLPNSSQPLIISIFNNFNKLKDLVLSHIVNITLNSHKFSIRHMSNTFYLIT